MARLSFLGGAGTVTGSRTLVETEGRRWLVDCGLFQGFKHLRLRNWDAFPVRPDSISGVLLTHAHVDHSGYLPRLVREGFNGPIHCTRATADLVSILLRDSAFLQEEDARFANERGFSKHHPAKPLYTSKDAEEAIRLLEPQDWDRPVDVAGTRGARFRRAGHILGASFIELRVADSTTTFSGDLGRPNDPIMRPPEPLSADTRHLVLEATYGDRTHDPRDPRETLAEIMRPTLEQGGIVLVPAFAVARAQTLLHYLVEMRRDRLLPSVPVYLNSPMAADVTRLYHKYRNEHLLTDDECDRMCSLPRYVRSVEESKALNERDGPAIIISASGMATGGRVLHHLKQIAPDEGNLILFVGFQAGGTRGASILSGEPSVKIHGQWTPVKARVALIDNLSAHADWQETLGWLKSSKASPRQTFLVHGEPGAMEALRHRILERLGWDVAIPTQGEGVELT